jgi:hypothetical protein
LCHNSGNQTSYPGHSIVVNSRPDIWQLQSQRDVPALIAALKSRHPGNVIAAANALGELGDRIAVEPLVMLFQSSSSPPPVRLAAAEALLDLKGAPTIVTLLGALRRDSWQARRNAAAILGQIQATWAVDPLAVAMTDPHPVVRRTAAAALRRIGTAEAIAALRARFASRTTETAPVAAPAPPAPPLSPVPASVSASKPAGEDVKPAEPIRTEPAGSLLSPPAAETTPPSRITRPVMKLIAYLKQRKVDTL